MFHWYSKQYLAYVHVLRRGFCQGCQQFFKETVCDAVFNLAYVGVRLLLAFIWALAAFYSNFHVAQVSWLQSLHSTHNKALHKLPCNNSHRCKELFTFYTECKVQFTRFFWRLGGDLSPVNEVPKWALPKYPFHQFNLGAIKCLAK